jgi:hypothetical protein
MSISFHADEDCQIMLPEMSAQLMDPAKAREALARNRSIRRSHLYPLVDATAHFACAFLVVPQGCETFEIPRSPWIAVIGDDMHFAWGPQAFGAESLYAAIKAADHGIMITCGPDPYPYRVAGTVAVRDRKNALIIETLPHQKEAWQSRVEAVRGRNELPITYCMPFPETKGAA